MYPDLIEEGWRQVKAGLALIVWSKLASWDAQELRLVASEDHKYFESIPGQQRITR